MDVLVAYASRHGTTAGIAERIADRLRIDGLHADAIAVGAVGDVGAYDAFVLGSAAYMFHWLKEATGFARRNADVLASRPLWLFSSGPVGTDLVDEQGRDVLVNATPKEFAELEARLRPRGTQVFFGAYDPDVPAIGLAEQIFRRLPASRNAMPVGDFRDWPLIDAWADRIATELWATAPGSGEPIEARPSAPAASEMVEVS
jgi:menaquinone-dependent protoporphyrinogen oxidase